MWGCGSKPSILTATLQVAPEGQITRTKRLLRGLKDYYEDKKILSHALCPINRRNQKALYNQVSPKYILQNHYLYDITEAN